MHFKKATSIALITIFGFALATPTMAIDVDDSMKYDEWRYEEVITPQYEDVGVFAENGLAAVQEDGLWGYINQKGDITIPCQFIGAGLFSEGKAIVVFPFTSIEDWRGYGIINETGTVQAEKLYFYGSPAETYFYNGYIQGNSGLVGWQLIAYTENGQRAFPDIESNPSTQNSRPYLVTTGPYNEGLFPAMGVENGITSYGWVDANGTWIKKYDWDDSQAANISFTGTFNQGFAPVWTETYNPESDEYDRLFGFMNRDFEWIARPQFDRLFYNGKYEQEYFGETGLAVVGKDGACGAIDKSGDIIIPFEYEELQYASCGLIVFKKDGKWGYLDAATLEVYIPAQYDFAGSFDNEIALIYDKGEAYAIDTQGNKIADLPKLDVDRYVIRDEYTEDLEYNTIGSYFIIKEGDLYGYARITHDPTALPSSPSPWATAEVTAAIDTGLVPENLQQDYTSPVSRADVAQMFVNLLEQSSGKTIDDILAEKGVSINPNAFTDTNDPAVLAVNALGIINGVGNNKFDPTGTLTRAQIAAIINREARVLGVETSGYTHTFTDVAGHWADDELGWPVYAGIINGVGDNRFDPDSPLTTEQAIAIAYRALLAQK